MKNTLETFKPVVKLKLSVPFIAKYLKHGKSQSDIARVANVSPQAVHDFIQRNFEHFEPLLDTSDSIMALNSKYIALQAQRNLQLLLEDKPHKNDKAVLNIIAGTQTDKYLMLKGQSPGNDHGNIGRNPQVMQQITVNVEKVIVNQIVNKVDNT